MIARMHEIDHLTKRCLKYFTEVRLLRNSEIIYIRGKNFTLNATLRNFLFVYQFRTEILELLPQRNHKLYFHIISLKQVAQSLDHSL